MAQKKKQTRKKGKKTGGVLTAAEIRQGFLDFFAEREHTFVRSSPVLPEDDTLLFTNAGMNQFKDVFLGTGSRDYTRAVNSQKCIRAGGKHNDLEDVGRDTYHQTFFEMLGNWSFGDYYKAEAISWAWELMTGVWGLPKDKLYATVHHSDDEAESLWKELTDIDPQKVLRFGDKDNFWEMANTGPCGPCSEIHIDLGDAFGPPCGPNEDSPRVIELWNLVFIQYLRDEAGELHDLPHKHVDTGMGFERICSVIQGSGSNYETDVFTPVIDALVERTQRPYGKSERDDMAIRAIADHVRTLTVSIADGVLPGNNGRNYVLRRILRRAARFGRELGMKRPFLHELVTSVVDTLGEAFPEVAQRADVARRTITSEEELFERTIDRGIKQFGQVVKTVRKEGRTQISGDEAWKLYGTYGFPVDLTRLMAEENALTVDEEGFEAAQREDQERSRQEAVAALNKLAESLGDVGDTAFVGYTESTAEATVLERHEVGGGDEELAEVVILDRSPFYAESGGQQGDAGTLTGDGCAFRVVTTQKLGAVWFHLGHYTRGGPFEAGAPVQAAIDAGRRASIERNHTATHLLHWALRERLGQDATQQGSLVAPDRLRFDFASPRKLDAADVAALERVVNAKVVEDAAVTDYETDQDSAREQGAMMLFGEKYGDVVRVVQVGDGYSRELCGGTHVGRTGEIGAFRIVEESPVQAGVRRIVALTGAAAIDRALADRDLLTRACAALKLDRPQDLPDRVASLQDQVKRLENELHQLQAAKAQAEAQDALGAAETIDGVRVVLQTVDAPDQSVLRKMGDEVKGADDAVVGLFLNTHGGKLAYVAAASQGAIDRGLKAGDLLRGVAQTLGGKGGGRPDMAQGGGGDVGAAGDGLARARELIEAALS